MKPARRTTAKTKIENLISGSKVALSHSEIQKSLGDICDRVTIYRVLDRLLDEGTIHKVVNVDGVVKYALCKKNSIKHKHNHIHFSCTVCKTVTCLEKIEPSFKLPKGYKISEINFLISGICPKCSLQKRFAL